MTAPSPRDWWLRYEVIHAVVYFDPECLAALDGLGFRGFWMGYFAGRAAPLGPIGPAPVTAAFFNFHPERARRSLLDAWTRARPTDVWATRTHAAAQVLRRVDPGVAATARALVPSLRALFNGVPDAGRPLFAATRATGEPDDPVESLWYWCSCLREHRGDGHVASLTAAGLDGCEALVLFAASEGLPVELLRGSRGWSDGEWTYARQRLTLRGLLATDGITQEGLALRRWIESTTDDLAGMVTGRVQGVEAAALFDGLTSVAAAVHVAGVIAYPNPMGLPAPAVG
jgi:hypothetical protein